MNLKAKHVTVIIGKVGGEEEQLKTKLFRIRVRSLERNSVYTVMAVRIPCISENISEIKLRDVAKRLGLSKAKLHHGSSPVDILVGIDHSVLHTGETKEVQNLVVRNSPLVLNLLTKVLSTIKDGLVRYCNTKTSHNGVNNMWILKHSTSLLSSLDQLDVRTATSVQTFDFSTLYTSIPHDLLKSRISNLVHNAFRKKDGSVRYTHIKVTRAKGYFTHDINGGGDNMYTADNICKMIEFLIDNIFVQFGGRLFRQAIGIPMGTNCAPLLADLFLYSYENEFLDNVVRGGHRRLARLFNLCYRYIDDLIVFNNKKFLDYLKEIYPSQLTVEKANGSDHLADYLDLTFIIDSGGKLSTRLYDKHDDFDFHIVNFPYLSSNIPSDPSYGVYISQLIRYARCCSHYGDFRCCHKCLVDRLLSKGYIALRLEKSFKKFYGRYQDLIEKYQRSVNIMVNDSFPG